jgi:hypothetical protein
VSIQTDSALLDWLDAQWRDGVHVEVCAVGHDPYSMNRRATVYIGNQESRGDTVR